ncbi:uncharacterized protein LOC116142580 [Pistacia vera]|uniref:uncharacterized protein LOC116142580 n=1 Tax=Pistacia vera TaxID=55513 RepID=UPI0012636484|nr:uncharacterized protein LOC116142580 [Pistacia vera]
MVAPSRVLEISVISAHDLAFVSKSMKTYVTAWIHSDRKVTTRVDQSGLNNPNWNEKFVFRVDDRFLADETSAIMIEIYAAAWLKDALIGSVRVLISHLFGSLSNNASATRFVALQVRRPSGRPQGILNMGITLLDNTMRSLPLLTELCAMGGTFSDISSIRNSIDAKTKKLNKDDLELGKLNINNKARKNVKLRRSLSDMTDLTSEDYAKHGVVNVGSMCNGSVVKGNNNNGSMVNESLCSSDVGPSASVVAAAIAKGLYKTPAQAKTAPAPANEGGNIGLLTDGWTGKVQNEENLKFRLDGWRNEVQPIYDHSKMRANSKRGGRARRRRDGGGLFSCFGNAFGCEISITCGGGGGNTKKRYQNGKVCHLSAVDDSISILQSYVARF